MREILFKAKRIDNGEWVEGFYQFSDWVYPSTGELAERKYYIRPIRSQDAYEVNPDTICQYTGLTDKNGKRIWENDILREYADTDSLGNDLYYYYKVFWDSCNSEYGVKNDVESMGLACVCTNESEVIGNVFDNAELMKE